MSIDDEASPRESAAPWRDPDRRQRRHDRTTRVVIDSRVAIPGTAVPRRGSGTLSHQPRRVQPVSGAAPAAWSNECEQPPGMIVRIIRRLAAFLTSAISTAIGILRRMPGPRRRPQRVVGEAGHTPASIEPLAPDPSAEACCTSSGAPTSGHRTHAPTFSTIGVNPEFGPRDYGSVFAALQVPPFSKLLDLVPVRLLSSDVFEHLADAWIAGPSAVPRLGILLSFERWVMLGNTALNALAPLAARGVKVHVFYAEQLLAGRIAAWFAHGRFVHNVPAVIETLMQRWYPSKSSLAVLDMLAQLVGAESTTAELPRLLTRIAALALSCGEADRAARCAGEALLYMPEPASATRCRALRALGTAMICQGKTSAGVELLDEAQAMAAQVKVPDVGASALCHSGLHALNHGDYPAAERRFRRAIELLSIDARRPHLRAFAHHNLAIALMHLRHGDAQLHAETALALRSDPDSHLAEQDRLLLASLTAQRHDRVEAHRRDDSAAPDVRLVSEAPPAPLASETNV